MIKNFHLFECYLGISSKPELSNMYVKIVNVKFCIERGQKSNLFDN